MSRPRQQAAARLQVEVLEPRQVPTVLYYGGNLLPHVEAQALFLGSRWASNSANAAQAATLNGFLTDVTGGAYMDALTSAGYGVGRGTAAAGAVDHRRIAAKAVISDATIQADLQAGIKRGLLQAPDANRLYIVYVEPNVAVNLGGGQGTTKQGILGYHGAFAGADASGHAAVIRYAVIAYPGGSVGNSSLGTAAIDQLTAVTSHELAEAVTDPDVNFGQLGWYDPWLGEVGDITENDPSAYVRLDDYLVQEVAGPNDHLLSIDVAPPTPPAGTITTTTTLAAGPVHYHWYGPATETLTVTITPGSGAVAPGGTVALLYDGNVLGTATVQVVNGVALATFDVEFFANGSYTFSAQYLGSGPFQGSASDAVTVTV
jgi:hypothetical protein